jgi:predicted Zn finger-like uncharacterized protein
MGTDDDLKSTSMSIVTLCPQCKTAFAIQAEHYSAADAWVRCGRCAHVFEVDQHLFEIEPGQPDEATATVEPPSAQPLVMPVIPPSTITSVPVRQPPLKPSAVLPAIVAVAATCFLLGQILMFHRNKLVAMNVSVSPVFNSVCQTMGCRVDWPKETEKVAIDSTNFKQLGSTRFSFSISIKNLAPYLLGTPSLELTLTNEEQEDVVRKVWFPLEMNFSEVLKPLRTQNIEMVFTVDENLAGKITGYRALLFYP